MDCILCLKGFYEWKLAGGVGVWRYGGTVRITSFPKGSPSSILSSESADESIDESESSQYEQLLDFLHLSNEVSIEESRTANALAFLFDHFGLGLLQAYLRESNGIEDLPLNAMVGKILPNLLCIAGYFWFSADTAFSNTHDIRSNTSNLATRIFVIFMHMAYKYHLLAAKKTYSISSQYDYECLVYDSL